MGLFALYVHWRSHGELCVKLSRRVVTIYISRDESQHQFDDETPSGVNTNRTTTIVDSVAAELESSSERTMNIVKV